MPIPFRCPHCGNQTQVADRYAGQSGPCSRCGQTVTIPFSGGAAAAAAPARSGSNTGMIVLFVVLGILLLMGLCIGAMFLLLMPAVTAARTAAQSAQQRTMDANNLKQIGLALHNYHDANGNMPPGTAGPEEMPPEQQLSWMAELLPYVEMPHIYDQLDFDQAWDSPANQGATQMPVFVYQDMMQFSGQADTQFVGIGGLGVDAPTLPADHERAGFFGYNRTTAFRDIRDGTSNTMAVAETHRNIGPWAQGGASTVRGLDQAQQPYVGVNAQFGTERGASILLGDGSVRFVQPSIAPNVLEALSTINGGEQVPPY